MATASMDRIDARILSALQEDGRISNVELAERVALSPTPCLRRVKRLEESGAITGYRAELDRGKVGLGVTAFVHINLDKHGPETTRRFLAAVDAIDEVISCHALTGTFDFILEIVTGSMDEYASVMLNRLGGLPNVSAIQTSFCLRSTKRGRTLPLTHLGGGGDVSG